MTTTHSPSKHKEKEKRSQLSIDLLFFFLSISSSFSFFLCCGFWSGCCLGERGNGWNLGGGITDPINGRKQKGKRNASSQLVIYDLHEPVPSVDRIGNSTPQIPPISSLSQTTSTPKSTTKKERKRRRDRKKEEEEIDRKLRSFFFFFVFGR
eukprot:TRINITY_DN1957_c0_g1_i1.p3 TRINITY_DN1957_c0_g1~~TRINITY_DN1957_c0_g1_i1.p3  ORF type:complete len:152 (+),score=27.94 TRINITY_DN1957_c0_g1_i1:1246-1701(+)